MDKTVDECIADILSELLDEVSTSAAAGPYMTPKAFAPTKKKRKKIELEENAYMNLKNDETATSTQKLGRAIQALNAQLHEMDRMLSLHGRLKRENGLDSSGMWKRSLANLTKMEQRLIKMANKIREMRS